MLGNIGSTELILILIILIFLFGSKRLTEIARGIGEVTREFKKSQEDSQEKKEN